MSDLGSVSDKGNSVNKRVVRALSIPITKNNGSTASNLPQSKKLPDPIEDLVKKGDVIEPPFDLLSLSMLPEMNSEMNQVIESMETNIEGFGHRLMPRIDMDHESASPKLKKDVRKEKVRLDNFFNYANLDDSFVCLRRKLRRDIETTGNGYLEIIRNLAGEVQGFTHIPSYQVRLGRLEDEPIAVKIPTLELQDDGSVKVVAILTAKKFRPYVQGRTATMSLGTSAYRMRWYKEFGDPRVMDNETGEYVSPAKVRDWDGKGNAMPEHLRANEIVHFKIYAARSPYGIPRYVGNLLSIYGDRKAEEINYYTFLNNNVPSMMLLVSNGALTQGSVDRIKEFVDSQISGSDNYSKMLILEAEGATEFEGEDPGQVRLDVKPMTDQQHKDMLFQEYSKNNQDKIRRAWRMPPILVGMSSLYNRSTAETARKLADEQVFAPERDEFDSWVNRKLFPEMRVIYHKFKSNSPNTTDNTELVKIVAGAEKTGGVTPRIARDIVADILGKELPDFQEDSRFDPDVPFSLTMAEAVKNQADPTEPGQQVTALKSVADIEAIQRMTDSDVDLELGPDVDSKE